MITDPTTFDMPIEPMACPRPRLGRHGVYYPSRYLKWRVKFQDLITKAVQMVIGSPLKGSLGLAIDMSCRRPSKTKLSVPRPDIDNLCKSVMDALNGILYEDDSQIISLQATKKWAPPARPGAIRITVARPS